jgi:hypothetical protein
LGVVLAHAFALAPEVETFPAVDPEPGLLESQCVCSHQKSQKTQRGADDARCLVGTKERTQGEEHVRNDHAPGAGVVHYDCENRHADDDDDGGGDDGEDVGQMVHGYLDHCFAAIVVVGDVVDAGARGAHKTTGMEEEAAEFLNADHMSSVQGPRRARRELVCK